MHTPTWTATAHFQSQMPALKWSNRNDSAYTPIYLPRFSQLPMTCPKLRFSYHSLAKGRTQDTCMPALETNSKILSQDMQYPYTPQYSNQKPTQASSPSLYSIKVTKALIAAQVSYPNICCSKGYPLPPNPPFFFLPLFLAHHSRAWSQWVKEGFKRP